MHLNQILDDYRNSDAEDKEQIFNEFITRLWKSKYTLKKYKKRFTYRVNHALLKENPELIELFEKYSNIEYTVCKSFFNKRLESIDYIRVHINNTYGYLADKDVYYDSQYYKLLAIPKTEYFKTIKALKDGMNVDVLEIEKSITAALKEAEITKMKSINRKINLSFPTYKKLINGYLKRIFENYKPIEEYEQEHGWEMRVVVDGWSEDNYIIKYFCRSLTGYMRNYKRKTTGFKKRDKLKSCELCGTIIRVNSNRKKYCDYCWKVHRNNYQKELMRHRRTKC